MKFPGVTALLIAALPILAVGDIKTVFVDLEEENVVAFVNDMVEEHRFDRDALRKVLARAEIKAEIIKKISTPAERTLTWGEYRKIFITPERINAGVVFWQEHKDMLERIAFETGVPIEVLVGIIGVETFFGRLTGNDRVIDALATLAFAYPPRSKFFRNELVQFLILAREEEVDPMLLTGSYAGAMGRPQFMPSSFRAYAVDATGDGKRDIWNDWADAAGSIANYFLAHGWKSGEEVTSQAVLGNSWRGRKPKPGNTLKPADTITSLSKKGVLFATDLSADSRGQLLTYENAEGMEHWVGFHNFFVITKYNRSVMYALAVHQLGQKISSRIAADAS